MGVWGVLSPCRPPVRVVIPAHPCGRRSCSTARAGPQRSPTPRLGGLRAGGCGCGCGVCPEGGKGTRCSAPEGTLGGIRGVPRACVCAPLRAAGAAVFVFPSKAVQQAAALIFKTPRRDFASGRAQAQRGPTAAKPRAVQSLQGLPSPSTRRQTLALHPRAKRPVVSFSLLELGISL